jgi:hypothetical protein
MRRDRDKIKIVSNAKNLSYYLNRTIKEFPGKKLFHVSIYF